MASNDNRKQTLNTMEKQETETNTKRAECSTLAAAAGSALRPMTLHTLRACRDRMKQEALYVGRYGLLHTPKNYDKRDKSKAFRCISYVDHVRWINALEEVISFFEPNTESRKP